MICGAILLSTVALNCISYPTVGRANNVVVGENGIGWPLTMAVAPLTPQQNAMAAHEISVNNNYSEWIWNVPIHTVVVFWEYVILNLLTLLLFIALTLLSERFHWENEHRPLQFSIASQFAAISGWGVFLYLVSNDRIGWLALLLIPFIVFCFTFLARCYHSRDPRSVVE